MTAAKHLVALLKSHYEGDEDQFRSIALQVSAHEARHGHSKLALRLRELVDEGQARDKEKRDSLTPLIKPRGELADLVSAEYPNARLSDMSLSEALSDRLANILVEQKKQQRLYQHGLSPKRKLLLVGPPGTGKTMTAMAIAGELRLPLFTVAFDALITKFMGETASKLRTVFKAISETCGIYLFDEFDAIGARRSKQNDVGEIRRVLNSFLQFLEKDDSNSMIIAATNHAELLDVALFRRFDDVIEYSMPGDEIALRILRQQLSLFETKGIDWNKIVEMAASMSHAELALVAKESAKRAVLGGRKCVTTDDLKAACSERTGTMKLYEDSVRGER